MSMYNSHSDFFVKSEFSNITDIFCLNESSQLWDFIILLMNIENYP